MTKVICMFEAFDFKQNICVMGEDGEIKRIATSTIKELPNDILGVCQANNTNKIHLIGSEKYANEKLIPAIKQANVNFGYNNLEIEVN